MPQKELRVKPRAMAPAPKAKAARAKVVPLVSPRRKAAKTATAVPRQSALERLGAKRGAAGAKTAAAPAQKSVLQRLGTKTDSARAVAAAGKVRGQAQKQQKQKQKQAQSAVAARGGAATAKAAAAAAGRGGGAGARGGNAAAGETPEMRFLLKKEAAGAANAAQLARLGDLRAASSPRKRKAASPREDVAVAAVKKPKSVSLELSNEVTTQNLHVDMLAIVANYARFACLLACPFKTALL